MQETETTLLIFHYLDWNSKAAFWLWEEGEAAGSSGGRGEWRFGAVVVQRDELQ